MKKKLSIFILMFIACCSFTTILYTHSFKAKNIRIRQDDNVLSSCFLALSDIHLHDGENQDAAECNCGDAGNDLWDSAKNKINQIILTNHPKFIVALGDFPFHFKGNVNDVENSFKVVYKDLCNIAKQHNLPLIIAPGNNDSYSGDYASLTTNHPSLFQPDANGIACYADSALQTSMGSYSVYPSGKKSHFKIVVLNSVIFSAHKQNNASPKDDSYQQNRNANIQITWLIKQLQEAKSNHDNVLIAMHIPPGFDAYFGKGNPDSLKSLWNTSLQSKGKPLLNIFLDKIFEYKNNIVGIISSHSHMDGLRLLIDSNKIAASKIASLLVSVPGIAPGHGNNPSMKLVTYNPSKNFELTNFTTYYMSYNDNDRTVKNFDSSYTFSKQFQADTSISIQANVSKIFIQDSSRLNSFISNIYFTKNMSAPANNNIARAIYVVKL